MASSSSASSNTPLVSVVIPVFNGEQYVQSAIETVQQQSYETIEVVAVDDGSTDHTAAFLQRAAEEYTRFPIRIVSSSNCGVAAARNLGVANAQGSIVSFLDVDDVWAITKIQEQVAALRANSAYVGVGCQYWTWTANPSTPERVYTSDWTRGGLLKWLLLEGRGVLLPSTLTCWRESILAIGGFDSSLGTAADLDLAWRLVNSGEVYCLESRLTGYRLSPAQMHRDMNELRKDYDVLMRKPPLSTDRRFQRRVQINLLLLAAYRNLRDRPSAATLATLLWITVNHPVNLIRMALNRR